MSLTRATPPDGFELTPLWISHHRSDQADHCTRVGRFHVCRRCLILYPLTLVTALVAVQAELTGSLLITVCILVALTPFMVDWTVEHLGAVLHSPLRSGIVSVIAAIGLGAALGVHLRSPFEPLVTVPVGVVAAVAAFVALFGRRRASGPDDADGDVATAFESQEAERTRRHRELLGLIEDDDG